jgi:hypothetical protein
VTRKDSDLLARLSVINRSLERVHQDIGESLRRAAERQDTRELNGSELRGVGHRLVSLAGELTTLGVDMARWADELDEVIDTEG